MAGAPSAGSRVRWWDPGRSDWQVAALFVIGATCFTVGAFPPYANWVGPDVDGRTYFVGSIFFTSAALLQVLISAGVIRADARPRASVRWRGRVRTPDRPEWWAGVVQFIGTLMFNISTFEAMQEGLSVAEAHRRVWTPDARGCIAFLVASALAYADVARPWVTWRPRDLGWSVATLNMVGSIAFAVSAVGAYIIPSTGELASLVLDNLGTFVGGLCFLVGAILLIPDEQLDPTPDPGPGLGVDPGPGAGPGPGPGVGSDPGAGLGPGPGPGPGVGSDPGAGRGPGPDRDRGRGPAGGEPVSS
jgi:hypothetical protein